MTTRSAIRPGTIGAIVGIAILAIAAIVAWQVWRLTRADQIPGEVPAVQVGGPFELIDHTGATVSDADYRGSYLLVYFGFTFCPDVCPTELASIATALDDLGAQAAAVTPLFITLDPERDSPAVLADYVALFHPRLVGLTGSAEQVAKAALAYRVLYQKEGDGPDYSISHTGYIYLMDPAGQSLRMFRKGTTPENLADALRALLPQAGA